MKRLLPALGAVAIGAIGGLVASVLLVRGPLVEPPPPAPVSLPPETSPPPTSRSATESSQPRPEPEQAHPLNRPPASRSAAEPPQPAPVSLSERSRLLETANTALEANHSDWNEGRCAAWPIQASDIDFCYYAIWTAMNRTADAINILEEHLARFPDDGIVRERLSALQTQSDLHRTLLNLLRAGAPSTMPG